jgi:acetyltransferase
MTKDHFTIRPIEASDKPHLQSGYKLISPISKRLRFFSTKEELNSKELAFFTEVDQQSHLAFVAIYDSQTPAGVIRCIKTTENPGMAELAIVIVDTYHRQGLGIRMLEILCEQAKKVNITKLCGDFHTSNSAIQKLLHKYCHAHNIQADSFSITHKGDGYLYFEMSLA